MPLPVLHHESESKKNSGRRPAIVAVKKSRYNKNKIMDCCEKCGTKVDLETHHIVPQAEAVLHPVSGKPVLQNAEGAAGISLHTGSNLRILCRTCHDNEHLT
jgi:5-methylcytosine-specific restriction endonuclease McrA